MKLSRLWLLGLGVVALVMILVAVNGAKAGEAYCEACNQDSDWSGDKKLDEIGNPNAGKTTSEIMPGLNTAQKNRIGKWNKPLSGFENNNSNDNVTDKPLENESKARENETIVTRSAEFKKMLVPVTEVPSDEILLDINDNATEHIQGSIAIPYTYFLQNNSPKSVEDIAKILGDAGISREDPVIIYGECIPCGGVPAPATLVYWIMKSLGQRKVRILDGTSQDWKMAGLPTSNETARKPAKNYVPEAAPEFSATHEYVKNGSSQIVDARSMLEFGTGSIPGATNIPYDSAVSKGRIKDEPSLERIFASLSKDRPVIVYTGTGIKASVIWFALELMGYNAKLYSYENWLYNEAARKNSTA